MNIGIYTHNIKTGKSGGVEQYANWIVGALLDYTGHKVFIFTNKDLAEVSILKWKRFQNCTVVTLPFRSKIFRFVCYNSFSNKIGFSKLIDWLHHKNGWRWMLKMFADPRVIIYCYNLDVLHFPTQIMPYYNWKIPIAVTLHDLQHEHLPEFFSAKRLATRRYWYEKSALECSQILTTYQHTKDDIIKYIGVPSEKISVTSFGFTRPNFFVPLDSASVLKKYNIPNNFLLYPARVWKHKNHLFLLKSIKMYKEKYGDIFLVCTGGKTELSEEIEKNAETLGLSNSVKFTGFINEAELWALYQSTSLVVIPTLFESGSGPLIESMFNLTPVICSNVTSLPSVIGDQKFIFNPRDKFEFIELINKMLTNASFREENIKNSALQIEKFKWNKIIKNYIDAYECAQFSYKNKK